MPEQILTDIEIRVLNQARTILKAVTDKCGSRQRNAPAGEITATGYDYGRAAEAADRTADSVFQVLNVVNAYHVQNITEAQMFNLDDDHTISLGTAEHISLDADEAGYELRIVTETGVYVANVHAVTRQLVEIGRSLAAYWAEGLAAARTFVPDPDGDGYDPNDPKSPGYHERMSAVTAPWLPDDHQAER